MQEADGKTTAHLKPNAYPCKKLYAFVQNHSTQAYVSGKFIGFENPLMDTSQDVSAALRRSEFLTDKDVLPKISSVLSTDATGKLVDSFANSKPKPKKKFVKQTGGICEDELIGEEIVSSDDTDLSRRPTDPEKGLQVIPALVKLPPRLPKVDLVGDSVNDEASASVGPITTSRLPNVDLANEVNAANEDEPVMETSGELSTSSINETLTSDHLPMKRRRGRRTKEEMRRREEDDDWEPSFWGRKALKKDGYASHLDADKKRKDNENRNRTPRSNDITDFPSKQSNKEQKSQEDGLEEEDEGWRVVEPIATGENKSDEEAEDDTNNPLALLEVSMVDGEGEEKAVPPAAKRRPGPASKTCRPRYIPPTKDTEADDVVEETGNDKSKENCPDENQSNLTSDFGPYDDSLLVDWSFFKSLLPDLSKLSHEKRIELKSFVLDTLNSAIYDGKPITPILNL
uniref:BESS domain-containing protein n=1 Tax=Lygus hesperus TaxID=30085 RepID=A0A0A9Z3V5_LYGHE